jgi:hypothetical protein
MHPAALFAANRGGPTSFARSGLCATSWRFPQRQGFGRVRVGLTTHLQPIQVADCVSQYPRVSASARPDFTERAVTRVQPDLRCRPSSNDAVQITIASNVAKRYQRAARRHVVARTQQILPVEQKASPESVVVDLQEGAGGEDVQMSIAV